MTDISREIEVLPSLEAVRRRPAMYIGRDDPEGSMCSRFVECAVRDIVVGPPKPMSVRVLVWATRAISIAYESEPLPIAPVGRVGDVPHPGLYSLFMELGVGRSDFYTEGAAVMNALSERLLVTTTHEGIRYRAEFSRGGLVALLSKVHADDELPETNSITFRPDESVAPGVFTFADAQRLVAEIAEKGPDVRIEAIDRTSDMPWWR